MEHTSQRMWFKLHYQSLKIRLDRVTSCTGGSTVAWIGDGHSYLIHLCISLASVIHFLRNCFQNVLMTSQPRAPQPHQCLSSFGWFMWRFPGLSFPQWLLHPSHSLWLSCPAVALGAEGTSKSGVPGMCLECVCTQRLELGCSWRGCDQEWGRQGAGVAELWLHRNNYLVLFLAGRVKYWSPLQQCYQV